MGVQPVKGELERLHARKSVPQNKSSACMRKQKGGGTHHSTAMMSLSELASSAMNSASECTCARHVVWMVCGAHSQLQRGLCFGVR